MKKVNSAKTRLNLLFILCTAAILIFAIAIVVVAEYLLVGSHILLEEEIRGSAFYWLLMFSFVSVIIGMFIAYLLSKVVLKPVNNLIDGMKRLADGDFSTRINMGKYEGLKNIADGFNSLAVQLQNTEILRSDFINNFSHELKTPMVSISGLLGLLKKDDLPKEKRGQYLRIIEEEMDRLAGMTTNILDLSRVEKQEILTDKTPFNISEQIRTSVLLLERKWSKKGIKLEMDFGEYQIVGNEDLLKQVWFNLIDNAIKFSDNLGEIKIEIEKEKDKLKVVIENSGATIDESEYESIFNKFYRTESGKKQLGNGIGLSIVKRIVELHGGTVSAKSADKKTDFTVRLPA